MLMLAERVPRAAGVKRTDIVQFRPAATEVPQVLDWKKSPGFVPVTLIPEMLNEPGPALDNVILVVELLVPTVKVPKLTLVVLSLTIVPVPLSATVCGLLLAFPPTVRDADRAPGA